MLEYRVSVGLIPMFADRTYAQTNPNYYKVLVNDDGTVLKKPIGILHKDPRTCLEDLYNEYLKVDYGWSSKQLVNCRKKNKDIEITYLCRMPYIASCNKAGKIINVNDFMSSIMDEYYVEIVTGSSPQYFR
jgi:hypothetical protein